MAAFMPEVLLLSSPRIIKKICIHPYTFHGVHAIPNFLPGNRDRLRYNLGIISVWFGDHLRDGIFAGLYKPRSQVQHDLRTENRFCFVTCDSLMCLFCRFYCGLSGSLRAGIFYSRWDNGFRFFSGLAYKANKKITT